MNRLLIIALVSCCIGCARHDGSSPTGADTVGVGSLRGQISGWGYGSHRHVDMTYRDVQFFEHVTATSAIDAMGGFYFSTLGAVPVSDAGELIYPVAKGYTWFIGNTLVCTDSAARFVWGQLEVRSDSNYAYIGLAYQGSEGYDVATLDGQFEVKYVYVTKDVNMSGTVTSRTYGGTDSTEFEDITRYDLRYVKGWNQQVRIYTSYKTYIDSSKTIYCQEYLLTNTAPTPARWYYYGK